MHRVDRLPVHRHQDVAWTHPGTGSRQRRAGQRVRRFARQHPVNPPAASRLRAQVGTEFAHVSAGLAPERVARRQRVGVRGAQLTEHFVEQVGEFAGGANPVKQRPVLAQHAVPVHPGHVGRPVVPAHDPAGLVVGALPQLRRVLAEPGPGEVHADLFAAGVVGLAVGRDHPDVIVIPDDGPLAVAADREAV